MSYEEEDMFENRVCTFPAAPALSVARSWHRFICERIWQKIWKFNTLYL